MMPYSNQFYVLPVTCFSAQPRPRNIVEIAFADLFYSTVFFQIAMQTSVAFPQWERIIITDLFDISTVQLITV